MAIHVDAAALSDNGASIQQGIDLIYIPSAAAVRAVIAALEEQIKGEV
jgi:hypothetical protein